MQRSRWRSLEPQRGFAAGPKRSKRVDAALERRKRQQALAGSQQAAAPAADPSAESENRIVASQEAASDPEIASVVGHSGAHSILCISENGDALNLPFAALCALRGVPQGSQVTEAVACACAALVIARNIEWCACMLCVSNLRPPPVLANEEKITQVPSA